MVSDVNQRLRVWIVMSLLAAAGMGGCGSDRESDRSETRAPEASSRPSVAQRQAAEAATMALKKHGWMVAGLIGSPAAFDDADCAPADNGSNRINCSFGVTYYGNMEPIWFEVRMQPNQSLSKVLGSRDPVPGAKSSAQTAALLASDEFLQHAPSRTRGYICRRAPRVEPDGSRGSTSASGQLCATRSRVGRKIVHRYVEFAADGTAARDYIVRAK